MRSVALEMLSKRNYVIGSCVSYFVLILLFFVLKDSQDFEKICYRDEACVRFCCFDQTSCSEKFIEEHFNASQFQKKFIGNMEEQTFSSLPLYGKPDCSLEKVEGDWHLGRVSST